MEDVLFVFFESADALCMFFHELLKHKHVKHDENDERCNEHPPDQMVVRKSANPDVGDIAAGDDPDEAGDEEEFFSRNFHTSEYTPPLSCLCETL